MDKLCKSISCGIHNPGDITDDNKKCESTGMEKIPILLNPRIRVNTSTYPQGNLECKLTTNVFEAEKLKSKMESVIQPLQIKGSFATSLELIAQEIKMKAGLSAQDIFRLRVPNPRNKMERICNDCTFYPVNEPRYRTPLVVLDLDTLKLIDPAIVSPIAPTFLDLLDRVYEHFDIALWSTIKMSDLVPKLEMLGLFQSKNKFKIHFILDGTSMTPTYFIERSKVKDIEIIWNMFLQYNEHNALMVNDYLKDQIMKLHNISPTEANQGMKVDEAGLKGTFEYLACIIRARKSLLSLNILMSKRYD